MFKMEGFVGGPIVIDTIGATSVVNFGGALYLSPKNISKSFTGSGAGHTNVVGFSWTGPSATNTVDTNVVDQPVTLNN